MKLVNLILITISVINVSCISTPGIKEPVIEQCSIITDKILECSKSDDPYNFYDISIFDAIGFKAVSPDSTAKINTHHVALHTDLNECLKK